MKPTKKHLVVVTVDRDTTKKLERLNRNSNFREAPTTHTAMLNISLYNGLNLVCFDWQPIPSPNNNWDRRFFFLITI